MNDFAATWIGPLLRHLAFFVAAAHAFIYFVLICPSIKAHTKATKILAPYFIVDEFKKILRESRASLQLYYAYWITFVLPLVLIILSMYCDMAKSK